MEGKGFTYWQNVGIATKSLWVGLKITLRHLFSAFKSRQPVLISESNYFNKTEGINTVRYPHEMQPIPDNGRYRLHNEIDDCIVCDKCAKICPVDCITIEPVRAVAEIGKTSDGTSKRIYAAKFDIDIGKCCFCGLCTTVCPTECLTMTKVYDFSVFDMKEHNFAFAEMTETEIAAKKAEFEAFQKSKQEIKAVPAAETGESKPAPPRPAGAKPVFKPKIKPPGSSSS
ncbi:MAG TPA: 4Fe-4S dicluster domain-containing protein [Ohtaekwangia sp.]|nr:4Fe-4S dicluster domain-containing protein [Ohtaekwangia sp.]